ncbi:MAG: class I SAM-dependent methyltransferase [candidate division KSB1 bacterium]|nr:class I SAM-dependent methyltransferase [candidate division KSB1 bacterium]MDZ7288185.1 class I SAM-dependent methyltransferase [candidate division KSB1 bacterium]MDZ7300302.1 class I SAM-dependent methyltransferase [candidate division KSB1 bacterium]MDZ7351302.1 class I SAM-dependent methyltransferase [candidate division KSB1 bacterium]MDZ7355606.1 class I SAM-dependent methyltransferase [candidate division KSB1 bacterium]
MAFKDHFSKQAEDYARYRPRYPDELFAFLAGLVPEHDCAWDCGTGSGQAALALARHFARVIASDPSARQIAQARSHARVCYVMAEAEHIGIAAQAVDLITVAQALHWFQLDVFYAEVRRVLKPGGVLAVWCYDLLRLTPEIDALLDDFNRTVVGAFWPLERQWVGARFAELPFPFAELAVPAFEMSASWRLQDLLGYLGTWSATQRFIAARGFDPVTQLGERLALVWGNPADARHMRWPLFVRAGMLRH